MKGTSSIGCIGLAVFLILVSTVQAGDDDCGQSYEKSGNAASLAACAYPEAGFLQSDKYESIPASPGHGNKVCRIAADKYGDLRECCLYKAKTGGVLMLCGTRVRRGCSPYSAHDCNCKERGDKPGCTSYAGGRFKVCHTWHSDRCRADSMYLPASRRTVHMKVPEEQGRAGVQAPIVSRIAEKNSADPGLASLADRQSCYLCCHRCPVSYSTCTYCKL
jgi:hypothetical protein